MSDTGLRRSDLVGGVVDRVMRVESQWLHPSTSPRQRLELLVDCVFPALDGLSLPRPAVEYLPSLGSTTLLGTFDSGDWTLRLSMSAVTSEIVNRDKEEALGSALGTTYHETRHYEQNFRARYYYLLQPKAVNLIRNNAPIYASEGKKGNVMLAESFNLPRWLADAFWAKFSRKDRLAGQELEEARAWYEESIGAHSGEQKKVMGDLDQMKSHRATIYCLYRTLVMEDDAFETGYLAGDQYLRRAFQEKRGKVEEKERMLKSKKDSYASSVIRVREKANLLLNQSGDTKGALAIVKQNHEILRRVKDSIQQAEININAEKKLVEGRQFSVDKLILGHQESMTEFRVTAHQKRWKYGRLNYLGTASTTGRK